MNLTNEIMTTIKNGNTTFLLNFLIHGKGHAEIKKEVEKELKSRGVLV